MKTTTTNELPCSVFGHNLESSSSGEKHSKVLVCKSCKSKISIDTNGEFESLPIKNKAIKVALRQLFLLESQYSRRPFSV